MKQIIRPSFFIFTLAGIFILNVKSLAQERSDGNKSPVPQYTFSNTLPAVFVGKRDEFLDPGLIVLIFCEARD